MSGSCWCFNPRVFVLLPVHLGTPVTGKGISFFADHIRDLTESFDSKLVWGTPYFDTVVDIYADRGLTQVAGSAS